MKNILIINDFVSLGKIAGKMMETVLSYKGHNTFFLPTALIANNFSYGKNAILDTTDYLRDTLRNWEEIGFEFDLISCWTICLFSNYSARFDDLCLL